MKDMLIEFIEEKVGTQNEEAFDEMMERMMDGEFREEFEAFAAGKIGG